ncbi:MAG: TIGR02099 family protein [Burkholderiaceae bacterium]|nr:TIGR02099 family protein [Burkholderiaceae bacterium]
MLRPFKSLAAWVRGLLWVAASFAVTLALAWGALHWVIVPRIDEFRPRLQDMASRALGVPVQIGALQARSNGLIPSITVRDLVLPGADGQPRLRVPSAVAAFSVTSLLRGGLEQLVLDGPMLDVRRTAAGHWQVAGLDLGGSAPADAQADQRVLDWVFSQPELVVRGGSVRWLDERRGGAPVLLADVLIVLRNGLRQHQLRLDATPPPDLGDRFSLRGQFHRALLERHPGAWQSWDGTLYAELPRLDLARLPDALSLNEDLGLPQGTQLRQGRAAMRLWADVTRGAVTRVLGDLAAGDVDASLGDGLAPLALKSLAVRAGWLRSGRSTAVWTQDLHFEQASGQIWPGGNARLQWSEGAAAEPERGQLHAERLDLAALGRIARSLPLPPAARGALDAVGHASGLIEQAQLQWSGPPEQPRDWRVQTKIRQLALAARPAAPDAQAAQGHAAPRPGVPGVQGADLDVDATSAGGQATLAIRQGALEFPGVFEEPRVPVQSLTASARWSVDGPHIALEVERLQLANDDATGEFRASWKTGAGERRFPGTLDLSGQFGRANGARVYRYLPQVIPAQAREYVRDAIVQGQARNVAVRVRGALEDFPFEKNPRAGEFFIGGKVSDVLMRYVPRAIQPKGEPPWPELIELGGDLSFDHTSMKVRGAQARVQGYPGWAFTKIEAGIPDLEKARVLVQAEGQGPLAAALGIVRASPAALYTRHALDQATAGGAASLKLALDLPIEAIERSRVQGSVQLAGNDLQLSPGSPPLTAAQGAVDFSETGFTIRDARARALGGDVRASGGSSQDKPAQVLLTGSASAEGLRAMNAWGPVAAVARQASGSARYEATLDWRGAQTEIRVNSDLRGLALGLPAPLAKPPGAAWPLRLTLSLGETREHMLLTLADVLGAEYEWDTAPAAAQRARGAVGVGAPGARGPSLPAAGVTAQADLPRIDADAWDAALTRILQVPAIRGDALRPWLPDHMLLRTDELVMNGRTLHQVAITGTREGALWRADVAARELAGRIDYREGEGGAAGAVVARLSRLVIPDSQDSPTLLSDEPPLHIPALDVVADNFELRGKPLGRLEVQAVNLAPATGRAAADGHDRGEWRLDTLRLSAPEADFSAHGRWTAPTAAAPRRRTELDFNLDIRDAGKLLDRLGTKDVVRRGKGQLAGRVGWDGAPSAPDYAGMDGQLHLDISAGQFLKADPGVAKLLGVLSLQSLPRRLTLDFRDVFTQGFEFDMLRGDADVRHGVVHTANLQMKGPSATVLMDGSANLSDETQDLRVLVVPHIDAGTAALAATVINPAIGIGAFLAQLVLQRPLAKAATREFRLSGSWSDPKVEQVAATPAAQAASGPEQAP